MALKTSILEILSSLLSPNTEIRVAAEERRKAVEVMKDYSTVLLNIVREVGLEADEERLMAAVLFRQCATNHWSDRVENYIPPVIGEEQKDIIRTTLPCCLRDPNTSVQTHICAVLAIIALSDYPDSWPNMPSEVLQRPHTTDTDYAATLSFIEDFIEKASLTQLMSSIDITFQFLFYTFNITKLNNKLQINTVKVTSKVVCLFFKRIIDIDVCKYSAALQKFCEAFCSVLLVAVSDDEEEIELSNEVLNAYTMMLNNIPQITVNALSETLPTVWTLLTLSAHQFDQFLLSESVESSNGHSFYSLGYNIFDMLYALLRTNPGRDFLTPILSELLYYLILYMAVPKNIEAFWLANPSCWFSTEFDQLHTSSMPVRTKSLLKLLTTTFAPEVFLKSLWTAVEKHILVCQECLQTYGCRLLEAIMYAIGLISKFIIRQYSNNLLYGFPLIDYLTQWARYAEFCPAVLTTSRIMWVGGKYFTIIDQENATMYIKIITNNLVSNSVILRYSAIRAFHSLYLSNKNYMFSIENRVQITELIINAIRLSDGKIIRIGLLTLGHIISTMPSVAVLVQQPAITLIRDLIEMSSVTTEIMCCSRGIISHLYGEIETRSNFENMLLSSLESIFNNIKSSVQDKVTASAICCRSIQTINSMIILSPLPLNPRLINIGFFGIYSCLINFVDDDTVLLNGVECIQRILSKMSLELISLRSRDGTSGLDIIHAVLKMVLTFNKMNGSAKEIAHFCMAVIHSLNPLPTSVGHLILQATLSILQQKLSNDVKSNLFTIVGYLFHSHIDIALNYLALMPGPQGENGLNFVLNKWLGELPNNYDLFEMNLNALTFARIIEHAMIANDVRLTEIMIVYKTNYHRQPSSTTNQVMKVPLILILIRVLLAYFMSEGECDSDSPPMTEQSLKENFKGLIDIDMEDSDDGDSDDEFCVKEIDTSNFDKDIISNLSLSEFIAKFFNSLSGNVLFCQWLDLLTPQEKATVRTLGN